MQSLKQNPCVGTDESTPFINFFIHCYFREGAYAIISSFVSFCPVLAGLFVYCEILY